MQLNDQQVQLFRHNGFIKLPCQLPEQIVNQLKQTISEHIRAQIEPVVRNRSGRVTRISSLWDRGGIFHEVLASDLVLDPLVSLLGPNIELIKNRHNHATLRLADDGHKAYALHRDVLQWT